MDVSTTTKNNNSQQLQQSKIDQNESSKPYNKETLFYLKDGIEWNMISAINSMNIEMTLMNDEISKDPNKLLQIPDFEPEETSFFQIEENKISSDGICIRLKRFLLSISMFRADTIDCLLQMNASIFFNVIIPSFTRRH
ncbi:hypothetical protein M9Y10_037169 [Tritrichomonas musculus]|uniref:Uncharacterized protein n=1 Tax=Tritrichomonas musculus TaxID=1915356 RepID=A0ABR2GT70_9EUKA